MISPLECSWFIEGLLYLLAFLLIITIVNFILVFMNLSESSLYKLFDSFTGAFVRFFGALLLFTILWIITASIYKLW